MGLHGRVFAMMVGMLLLLVSQPTRAVVPPISKNAIALSKAMVSKSQFERLADAIVETGMSAASAKVGSEKLKVDLDAKAKQLEASLREAFSYDHLITLSASRLSSDFKDEELSQILAFYESPMGKKWTQYSAEHISNTLTTLHEELESKLPKMLESLKAK
jgi:hypothetical protein